MAEVKNPTQSLGPSNGAPQSSPGAKRGPSIHQIYALPAPIRTFPLPTFYPENPLSIFHVVSAWLRELFSRPPLEPATIHEGIWSEATTSVHVKDEKSMRALWEQGFYGKGNLSRSEPNWLKRERVRRGLQDAHVSEIMTIQRRQERAQAKWERARLEQEAIRNTRLAEARQELASQTPSGSSGIPQASPAAPVGPLQLLALPNADADLPDAPRPVSLARAADLHRPISIGRLVDGNAGDDSVMRALVNGDLANLPATDGPSSSALRFTEVRGMNDDFGEAKTPSRPKSVRFSPKVESTTFQFLDPPSPSQPPSVRQGNQRTRVLNDTPADTSTPDKDRSNRSATEVDDIVNKEHLQLTLEEAFFLSFGLGALGIIDGETRQPLSNEKLLTRFRQYSYFPPRIGPEDGDLGPDDNFLVHYAVYHHFRSLGWVPRAGIKFGVDWLLYTRGPVFDHAEFGIMVIPSYSDSWWKRHGKQGPRKTWAWLHNSVRVLSHVMKSLVLVYVDVPAPASFEAALDMGITEALRLYKIREVTVKRWSSNRNQ